MPSIRYPRRGSLQYWPRCRAARIYPVVSNWPQSKEPKALGFAGYKAAMCHIIITDARKTSKTKGEDIFWPATIIECPNIKVIGARLYKGTKFKMQPAIDIMAPQPKDVLRKLSKVKKQSTSFDNIKPEEYIDARIIVATQPRQTGIGKKKPEVFEIGLGGSISEKIDAAKNYINKDMSIFDVFKAGDQVDTHAVTTGKGFQGPVKRFGVKIRFKKSEKTKRGPGSLGPWHPRKVSFRVPHAGQTGYQTRVEYNKLLLMVDKDKEKVLASGGLHHYGVVKNDYVLVKGSVTGPKKRLIIFTKAMRPTREIEVGSIQKICL